MSRLTFFRRWCRLISMTVLSLQPCARALADDSASKQPQPVKIVTLGDSITRGVRKGVKSGDTFAVRVQAQLKERGVHVKVVNVGIGGERTDQALVRLASIIELRPRYVTVMYGTNDSYVDSGKTQSRLSVVAYRENLEKIVSRLLLAGIEPILMTEPSWANGAKNGMGEDPNLRLKGFMEACRQVARENHVPIVDHFKHWREAAEKGQDLNEWTTDRCHPNPRGHREITASIVSLLHREFELRVNPIPYRIELKTIIEHDDGRFLWFHPRVTALPGRSQNHEPEVLMTLQKHLHTSDHYSGLSIMRTADLGRTWSGPRAPPELGWIAEKGGVDVAVADVTPGWHAKSGRVIAIGAQVRYSPKGKQLEDQPRSHQTAYAVFEARAGQQAGHWTGWRRLRMPPAEQFNFARSACAQFIVEKDGTVLLPFYIASSATVPFSTTVVRCTFDGDKLEYQKHGEVLRLAIDRGLYEPSLVSFQGRYFMTLRNDRRGYVTVSDDGLKYRPIKPWLFDDGRDLGSYNTQQHWLSSRDGLFLVYTRRGADNDHIMRHRAPLFIAQVDSKRLHVIRGTERILVPERGATLGNFGAAVINDRESWVTVAEGVWSDRARHLGAKGAVYLARVIWGMK